MGTGRKNLLLLVVLLIAAGYGVFNGIDDADGAFIWHCHAY